MKHLIPLAAVAFGVSGASALQLTSSTESQTKMKIEDTRDKNKVSGDIDQEITNAKMRAESGSKSKFSGSLTATYNGGSLETPGSATRPNLNQEVNPPRVFAGADLAVRYRMDKNNSFVLGVGASLQQPFHDAQYGDISNPYAGYNHVTKLGQVQSVSNIKLGGTTNNDEYKVGNRAFTDVAQTFMWAVGGSKLSVGIAFNGTYTLINRSKDDVVTIRKASGDNETVAAGKRQRDYTLAAYPVIEYAFTDKVQFRTVFRPWIYDHSVLNEGFTFAKRDWTQSVGLGFAVTRDVYLYPNFQWNVEDWRGAGYSFANREVRQKSTVGLLATINVF